MSLKKIYKYKMSLVAPYIFAVIFMFLVSFSSLLFKIFLKIKSFTGLCSGIVCSVLTIITAGFHSALVLFVFMRPLRIKEDKNNNSTSYSIDINQYINYTNVGLFILWVFSVVLMSIVFFFILTFTKRVSKPEDDYNSVFMFVSGYILIPFLTFYIIWMTWVTAVNQILELSSGDGTKALEVARSLIHTLVDFAGFIIILLFTGTIIMCMLHHRKVNPIIIKINVFSFLLLQYLSLYFYIQKFST